MFCGFVHKRSSPENIRNIKMMVLLGEVGGREEYLVAEALEDGRPVG